MGPKRFKSENFSLFKVKFKKLGFSAPITSKYSCTLDFRVRILRVSSPRIQKSVLELIFEYETRVRVLSQVLYQCC